jgi:hypothetical protein
VIVAVIVVLSTTVTLLATGRAPDPFSKLTPIPAAKPEPVIVTGMSEPCGAVSWVILETATVLPVLLQPVLSRTSRINALMRATRMKRCHFINLQKISSPMMKL